jgi:hypothetical protein
MLSKQTRKFQWSLILVTALLLGGVHLPGAPQPQGLDPTSPNEVVRLIFIHHSCGENWLNDDHGGLANALQENNYFVSDTNYGWGPDGIGDSTDIPNWLIWFRSEETARYTEALYEESDRNSPYARFLDDPGGENQVIMFKSCFPNSELGGRPDDSAGTYEDTTVAGAKYVYNELLHYFRTRPDKLFVVITAPPVSDSSLAENARAFNLWLVNDWLQDNSYPLNNVAVFDFYNVLTGPDNHHRFVNGIVEHTYTPGMNTSYYSSSPGDDHPSEAGNRKATEEFVPLLNVHFHLWQSNPVSSSAPQDSVPPANGEEPQPEQPRAAVSAEWIDDFETGGYNLGTEWEYYMGAEAGTQIQCAPAAGNSHNGSSALEIAFEVPAEGWATCIQQYSEAQDWSAADGVTFYASAEPTNLPYDVHLYVGWNETLETYVAHVEGAAQWTQVDLPWDAFTRVAWEPNGGATFTAADQISGLGFGFEGDPSAYQGTLWADDIRLMIEDTTVVEVPEAPQAEAEAEAEKSNGGPCLSTFLLPIAALGIFMKQHAARTKVKF